MYKDIEDHKVCMMWQCPECVVDEMQISWHERRGEVCWLEPDWYQDNGTPVCACGVDMDYIKTQIKID